MNRRPEPVQSCWNRSFAEALEEAREPEEHELSELEPEVDLWAEAAAELAGRSLDGAAGKE